MRLVRLVALACVVAAALLAQLLFDGKVLSGLHLDWVRRFMPALMDLPAWTGAARNELATWLSGLALAGVGLLAPAWHGEQGRVFRRPVRDARQARRWYAWIAAATALATGGLAFVLTMRTEPGAVWLWLASLVAIVLTGWAIQRSQPSVIYADRYDEAVWPERGWPYLVLILFAAAALYLFRMPDLPARVDPPTAAVGLASIEWQSGEISGFFSREAGARPRPTLLLMTGAFWVTGDSLWSARLAGMVAGLALIAAVWLLGCELFRRVPAYEYYGEVVEDDGRWMALLATLAATFSVALYHFGRTPVQLEPVALGALGLWALLRGLRLQRVTLLGLSATILGWAAMYGPVGWVSVVASLWTWLGVALWEPAWLEGKTVLPRTGGTPVRVQEGVGQIGFGFWLAGVGIAAGPLVAGWLANPIVVSAPWAWWGMEGTPAPQDWFERLTLVLLAFVQSPSAEVTAEVEAHFVHSLLMPVLMLGFGALVLSIDSVMGWSLTLWSVTGLSVAALLAPTAPNWPAMLALVPMISLVMAFGFDRLRVMVMTTLGTWSLQATVYLAVGTILAAGLFGWIGYYGYAQRDTDFETAVGRAIATAGKRPVGLVGGSVSLDEMSQSEVVRMLASDSTGLEPVVIPVSPPWISAPRESRLLIAPPDWIQVGELESVYPDGELSVVRDVRANPVLYIFDLPAAQ